jgi:phosphoribosylcarboxyaminoimidazole (NCAIR) mutase
MATISQGFGDARSRARQGVIGDWVYSDPTRRSQWGLNSAPQAAQVSTVTVTGATNAKLYTITINGVNVSFTSDASATTTEIATGLALAVNAEPLVRGQVRATSAVAVVTLTGVTPGEAFTLAESDAELTIATTTTADTADPIPFGRVVIDDGQNTSETERLVALADTTQFAAQVITLTPTYVASAVIKISVYEIRGEERILTGSAVFTSVTDLDATIDGLVAALNTALPANTVLVAANLATATAMTFTAEVLGAEWDIEVTHEGGGASVPALVVTYTTGPSIATSLHRAFQGVSLFSASSEAALVTSNEGQYNANEGVNYAMRGVVWVESSQTPAAGGTVYVELTAGATAGRLYTDSSATRVALARSRARWERDGLVAADNLAAVRLEA